MSQPLIHDCVDICTKLLGIDRGQIAPAPEERGGIKCIAPERPKLCHRCACPGDQHGLPRRHAINHIAAVVPQVPDGHALHRIKVSRVRQHLRAKCSAQECCDSEAMAGTAVDIPCSQKFVAETIFRPVASFHTPVATPLGATVSRGS